MKRKKPKNITRHVMIPEDTYQRLLQYKKQTGIILRHYVSQVLNEALAKV